MGRALHRRRITAWQALDRLARGFLFLCLVLSAAAALAANDTGEASVEQKIKAASLLRFLAYVEWPAEAFPQPAAPYVIGVVNSDDIADELAVISTVRTVNNRSVTVRRLKAGDATAGLHALFIGHAENGRLAQWLKPLQNRPVLTVTEADAGLAQGSMINFRVADERVRFEVALDPIEKAGLKVSSRMLSVALSVVKGTP